MGTGAGKYFGSVSGRDLHIRVVVTCGEDTFRFYRGVKQARNVVCGGKLVGRGHDLQTDQTFENILDFQTKDASPFPLGVEFL